MFECGNSTYLNMKLIVLLLAAVSVTQASKILFFFPVPSPSVGIIGNQFAQELAEKGHNVTVVTVHPSGNFMPNLLEVIVPMPKEHKVLTEEAVKFGSVGLLTSMGKFIEMSMNAAEGAFEDPYFKYLMREDAFDLIVFGFAFAPFQQGLAAHFKCPYIILTSVPPARPFLEMVGQGSNPEAVPSLFLSSSGPMTLWQRVMNLGAATAEYVMTKVMDCKNGKLYEKYFPAETYPSYNEIKLNVSLIMTNSHFSVNGPRPLLPNVVEVGGLQIKQKPDPLPIEIKAWIEDATEGVVLVSLGSNLKSSKLPQEKLQILLNAFSKLKQRVIWKFESNKIPKLPVNVMVQKWLPQDDILAHPNTQLFISHCGLSSYNEALYHGVPIVGIPVMADQPLNAQRAQDEGWAEYVKYTELTQEALDTAVAKVLGDPKYKTSVQRLSKLYKDRPMSPMETAVYWVEYVLRHHGAPHLHYQGAELTIIQKMSLDVWGFILAWIYILIKMAIALVVKAKNAAFGKKQKTVTSKKKKKN